MAGLSHPLRWALVIVDLDPTVGHEQAGQRRALVVSYEAFHRSGMAAVCPVSARPAKYPGEVDVPIGMAGQTKDAVILVHQLRTIDLDRVTTLELGGKVQYVRTAGGSVRIFADTLWRDPRSAGADWSAAALRPGA